MKPRLLLVDDDAGAIHVLHRLLGQDFELRYALDGDQALALAAQSAPDLILLDAQMPGISGTEVCRRLKADPMLAAVPVIFVTSLPEDGAALMSLELGAADVVSKPLDEARLLAAVRAQLPAVHGAVPSPDAGAAAPAPPPCVLIVDDDPAAVQAIHAALGGLGARFLFATDGASALRQAHEQRPDLVLLDMYMPGLDGLEVLRRLRADETLAAMQVIVVTRYAFPEMEQRALEAGGVDFVAKPYSQAVLHARVRNVLRLQAQAQAMREAEGAHWRRIGSARLARVVAAASDAIVTADAAGSIVLINAAACRMFGVDAAFQIGRPLAGLLPELGEAAAAPAQRCRLTLAAQDGRRFPVELSLSRVGNGAERLTTLVLRDLSEQQRAEAAARAQAEAEAALRAKSLTLSYLAHEIGNPLNAIVGFTQLMQTDPEQPLPPAQAGRLQHVADAGAHLRALMRDVLDLQRLEAGRFEVRLLALDAVEVARRAVDAVAAEAAAAGVRVSVRVAPGVPRLRADETRLHQCLLNLLGNAIKYNRRGGQVELEVTGSDGAAEVALAVRDDGPGLSAAEQQQLFEPFNRLGRGGAGAGIGLVLTRLLVGAMDGRIAVESAPGRGSAFTLRLPAASA
jgi:PAS domain S-box-containing protein